MILLLHSTIVDVMRICIGLVILVMLWTVNCRVVNSSSVTVMLIYTHCWELMNSVGSHGSSSLPFVMKLMVCHFVSDSHEVMTALIVVLPLIVVVEISLQLHRSCFLLFCRFSSHTNFHWFFAGL